MQFKTKQKLKRNTKIFFKNLLKILLLVLLTAAVVVGVTLLQKYMQEKAEKKELIEAEIVHEVKRGSDTFNVATIGKEDVKHTIVTIADLGVQDFAVYAKQLTSAVKNSARLVIIDRLGSGYSSDTREAMTIEKIVGDYRDILIKQNIEGPYILLAHNYGGAYATYWESLYPDEIEGVIYLDSVELSDNMRFDSTVTKTDYAYAAISTLGLEKFIYDKYYAEPSDELEGSKAILSYYLNKHSAYTFARLSEKSLLNENMKKAYEAIQKNDIPKMYISSSYTFERDTEVKDYLEFANNKARLMGQSIECDVNSDVFPEYSKEKIESSQEHFKTETQAFIDALGNCHLVKMPGDKYVYEQYTEDVKAAITGFIRFLDGRAPSIYERYFDPTQQKWKQYAATIDWDAIRAAEEADTDDGYEIVD